MRNLCCQQLTIRLQAATYTFGHQIQTSSMTSSDPRCFFFFFFQDSPEISEMDANMASSAKTTLPETSLPEIPQELPTLCNFCSAINFSLLRVPTASQVRRLAAGENIVSEIEHSYPFKRDPEQNTRPSWELGTLS